MKNKIKMIFNILKNYSKYRKLVGTRVLIVKNKDLEKYNNYIGRTGVVYGFQFDNTKNPFIIRFTTGEKLCFNSKEFWTDKQIRKDVSKRMDSIFNEMTIITEERDKYKKAIEDIRGIIQYNSRGNNYIIKSEIMNKILNELEKDDLDD